MNNQTLDLVLFAVWVPGIGWLRGENERIFASDRREISESAARLYGSGAFVTEFDGQPMADLERVFLEREREREARALELEQLRSRGFLWRIWTRFFHSARS